MKFSELKNKIHAESDSVVVCFGRFQCPTEGHNVLINKVISEARMRNADHMVCISASHDSGKNPLSIDDRVRYMHEMFPGVPIANKGYSSLWEVLMDLSNKGLKHVTLVAGGDRVVKYQNEFPRYLNHKDPTKKLNFESLNFVNAGNRDPEDEKNVSGISASRARDAAKYGSLNEFMELMPKTLSKKSGLQMLNAIRESYSLSPLFEEPTILMFRRDAAPEVETPYEDPGIYSSFNLTEESALKLHEWAEESGIPNICSPDKFHCTVVWSKISAPEYKSFSGSIELDPSTFSFDILHTALVLRFQDKKLQGKWNEAKSLGAEPTFTTYKPHITLSYDPENFDIDSLKYPHFPIVLEKETVQTLKETYKPGELF
jgi:hypothetical protein